MAKSVTLASLLEQIRSRYGLEVTDFVTTAELTQYIQDSKDELYDLMLMAWGEPYFTEVATVYTTAGSNLVALPSTFYKLLALDFVPSGSAPIELDTFDIEERNAYGDDAYAWDAMSPPRYRLRGAYLWFVPKPNAVYALRVLYVPACPDLTSGIPPVTFNGVNGWTEYIVCDVCAKIAVKEEASPTAWLGQKAAVADRVRSLAPAVDQYKPRTVRRVSRMRADSLYRRLWGA